MQKRSAVRALLCLVVLSLPAAHRMMGQEPVLPESKGALAVGAAWYPEQWPAARWEADLTLMEAAHVRWVRIAEFAWARMEPKEGQYDFEWLDQAIRMAEKHHIAVVLSTPGATPPAWLTSAYPETLRTLEDGRKDQHGNRQQFDFGSPKYRALLQGVVERMAVRYGHDPNVVAWQLDNELANPSFGANNRAQFQAWLKQKYGTLDNLNARWTTQYWSEAYTDWSQIPIETSYGNPGLLLNWKQFVSETWRSYDRLQIDTLRRNILPRQKITTNMMGLFDGYDHYVVAKDLDFISWDAYVGTGHLDPVRMGFSHDLMRGLRGGNFWVMETQPGSVNWSAENNALNLGEVRAMAWNDVGHGADAVGYWQWRSALNGQEQYHGTLVGPDGTPVPLYAEVQQLGEEFARAGAAFSGTQVHSDVAILQDYDSRWAIDWQRHNRAFDPVDALLSFYRPLRQMARSIDVVSDVAPLAQYKLVVAPALNVLTPAAVENLKHYVEGGGTLVLGQRSGMKDEDNGLQPMRQPGPLTELLGARVEQFYSLDEAVPFDGLWGKGKSLLWAERMQVLSPTTQVLMRYGVSNGWLDGQPAVVTRPVGKGSITYIGAGLEGDALRAAAQWMLAQAHVNEVLPRVPAGVDVSVRSGAGRQVYVLINFNPAPVEVSLPTPMQDVLGAKRVTSISLARYGVAVLSTEVSPAHD